MTQPAHEFQPVYEELPEEPPAPVYTPGTPPPNPAPPAKPIQAPLQPPPQRRTSTPPPARGPQIASNRVQRPKPTPVNAPQSPPKAPERPAPPPETTARPRQNPVSTPETPLVDRMPPHDLNAEAAVLGAIIIDPACIPGVRTFLRVPEAFFKEEHQTFFRVICEVVDAGHPMDAMILHSTLKTKGLLEQVGGIDYIKALANSVPTSSHAEYYAAIVNEKAQLRQQIRIHTTALKNLYENGGTSDALKSAAVENLAAMEGSTQKQAVTSVDALRGALDELERHREGELTGLSTGLVELDNLTGGLQNGEMIIVAARPSVGKTALAMNFVEHVTLQLQQPVAVFSMEMSDKMLMKRMLCGRSGISSHKFRGGHLSEADKTRLGYAVGDLSGGVPFYIDDSSSQTIGDIRGKASRLVKDKGCVMVVIDYMQLMECSQKGLNRQAEITIISRGIKALARDLNVPVVALSQLNRSSESEGRLPRCSDLRESGSIEQDADTILLLHREAVLHRGDYEWEQTHPEEVNSAMLIVAKQRSGPCDSVKLTFLGPQTRFYTYSAGI